jgi:hypothetical protein
MLAPNIAGADAEVTAFRCTDEQGWQPVAGGASRPDHQPSARHE